MPTREITPHQRFAGDGAASAANNLSGPVLMQRRIKPGRCGEMDNVPDELVNYPLHERTLPNGLRVVVSPDHSVPVVAVNLWYDVGSRDEAPGQFGWAHLFEHLMFSGSAHVATGEHLQLLQNLGGSVNATTWFDRTNYFETVPVGATDLALWMEADRLATLADHLTDASVDTQRDVVTEEKRQRYDNVPYGEAMTHLVELVFGADHPYGHTTIGSATDLAAADARAAADFFRAHYQPHRAVLTLVGDLSPKEGFRKALHAFGSLPGGERRRRDPAPVLPPLTQCPRTQVDAVVPAAASYFAWRLPARDTPEFDAVDLALAVLGQGQTSRLHRVIVRDQRAAATASAQAVGLIGGNSLGLLHLRAIPGTAVEPAADLAIAELDALAADGPTETELARAKAQFRREWLSSLARFDSRADLIGAYATLHDDPQRINHRLQEVSAVTSDHVRAAAATLLRADQRCQLDYRNEAPHATA